MIRRCRRRVVRASRPCQAKPFLALVVVVLALLVAVDPTRRRRRWGNGVHALLTSRIPTKAAQRRRRPSSSSCPTAEERRRKWGPLQCMGTLTTQQRFMRHSAPGGVDEDAARRRGLIEGEPNTSSSAGDTSSTVVGAIEEGQHNPPGLNVVECASCHRSFASRNALFRHLRGQDHVDDHEGSLHPACVSQLSKTLKRTTRGSESDSPRVPFRVAVQFGYHAQTPESTDANKSDMRMSAAERAASLIQQSLLKPLDKNDAGDGCGPDPEDRTIGMMARYSNVTITSVTQSTAAKLRAAGLRQERDCSAASDVIVLSGDVAVVESMSRPRATKVELTSSLEEMLAERLFKGIPDSHVRVDAIRFLDKPLHAERSCTQYVYHYLMPVSWLADPEHEMSHWVGKERLVADSRHDGTVRPWGGTNSTARRRPPALVRLKQALRSMESPRLDAATLSLKEDDSEQDSRGRHLRRRRVAAGRFGGLAYKSRQAFHNYCDQQLMGAISPNHDVVWRCVDRARIVDFVTPEDDEFGMGNETTIVLDFRGDAFLQHQIRTMVGTALSMANGWLPMDTTVLVSTNPDHIVAPLPCAPSGRLYLASTRFHFEELSNSGKPLFDPVAGGRVVFASKCTQSDRSVTNVQWIQSVLLSQKGSKDEKRVENEWLRLAERTICTATRASLAAATDNSGLDSLTLTSLSPAPVAFNRVLSNLRRIVATKSWPETTAARFSVIRVASEADYEAMSMGSFTVVNPVLVEENLHHMGNVMFPELASDVFALEQALSEQKRDRVTACSANGDVHTVPITTQVSSFRRPSTHCAINCNAQFTPHVDSGRGAGQSMSMIVGLGDYAGGELMVEGSRHDIRYGALEFDGWKLRHWTRPFQGERFSLVWFTPATSASTKEASTQFIETQNL